MNYRPILLSITTLLILCSAFLAYSQELPKDFLNPTFHKQRRQELRKLLPPNSVAVLFANPVRNRANDVDYVYHQDPDFYYLTGYKEPHSVLLVFSDAQTDEEYGTYDEAIFVQHRDPLAEMWNGRRLGVKGVKEQLGFDMVFENADFKDFSIKFDGFDKVLFLNFHNDIRDSDQNTSDLFDLVAQFKTKTNYPIDYNPDKYRLYDMITTSDVESSANVAQTIERYLRFYPLLRVDKILVEYHKADSDRERKKVADKVPETNLDGYSLNYVMNSLREIKTEEEMVLLRKAIQISAVGQREVMKAMKPGMSETEIQGVHEFVYKKYGAEYEGYPSIVGGGNNGCILHYIENNKPQVSSKELVLMDLGAEYHGYTADVTRTIPANGKFSKEQKLIYNLVYEAQEAGFQACKPGAAFREPHQAAADVINTGLIKLGIIEEGEEHRYFPHGTSHYLGLDVHDRGNYGELKKNMVITVEPGIYIPDSSKCDPKWWGIAVRIEDDILITEKGFENLSSFAPRTVKDIEELMAKPSALDDFILPALNEE